PAVRDVRNLLLPFKRYAVRTAEDPDPVYASDHPALCTVSGNMPIRRSRPAAKKALCSDLALCRHAPSKPSLVQPGAVSLDHAGTRNPVLSLHGVKTPAEIQICIQVAGYFV